MKKFLLLLTILTCYGATSLAFNVSDTLTYEYKGNTLTYVITSLSSGNETVKLINDRRTIASGDVTVPATIINDETTFQVSRLETYAFNKQSEITSVTFEANITNITGYCFQDCTSLETVYIPSSCTNLAEYIFSGCTSLTNVIFEDETTLKSDGWSTWNKSTLLTNTINGMLKIGNLAFKYNGKLNSKRLVFPDGTILIGSAFTNYCTNCNQIQTIVVPSTVKIINYEAFYMCTGVDSLVCLATTPPDISNNTLRDLPNEAVIYVPYSADHSVLKAYQGHKYWKERPLAELGVLSHMTSVKILDSRYGSVKINNVNTQKMMIKEDETCVISLNPEINCQ